jgi:hypothetical protein
MSAQSAIYNPSQTTSAATGDGFSVPRLTTTGRLAIVFGTSDAGMMVFDTTLNNLFIWTGSAWESVPASGDAGANGAVQYNDNGVVSGASSFFWDKANNRVGIGTSTPLYALDVKSATASNQFRIFGSNQNTMVFGNTAGTAGDGYLVGRSFASDNANNWFIYDLASSALRFFIGGTGNVGFGTAGPSEAVDVSSGNVRLGNGNVILGTSGKGIDFSATPETPGATSEIFNDYEEGVWTGTIKGSVSDPTTPVAVTGRYTKIGRAVTVQISFESVNTTGASGDISITGLPFTVQGAPVTGSAGMGDILNYTGTLTSAVNALGTTIFLVSQISASYATLATHKAGASKNLQVTMTYTV